MFTLILAAACLQSADNAMEYVRAHREADAALVAGKLEDARTEFGHCLTLSPKNAAVAYGLASVESRAAKTEKALAWLERAVEWGYADAAVALWDEDLAKVRQEARFDDALRRMRELQPRIGEQPALSIWDERNKRRLNRELPVITTDPDGEYVVVARPEAVVQLLDAKRGHALRTSSGKLWGDAVALEFHPDGREVFLLTSAGKVQSWSISGESAPAELGKTLADLRDLPFGMPFVRNRPLLRVDREGERLLVLMGGRSGTLFLDTHGSELRRWPAAFAWGEQGVVAWSPDSTRIAWCDGATVRFDDGRTGEPTPESIETHSDIDSMTFSRDGTLLATGHDDGCVRLWSLATKELKRAIRFGDPPGPHSLDPVDVLSISPDGRWLADGMSDSGIVEIWDLSTDKLARRFQGSGRGSEELREPFQWTSDSRRMWSCFPVSKVAAAALDESFPVVVEQPVACLRLVRPDRALALDCGRVFAFDPRNGVCLWTRPDLGRAGEIVHCSSGYFETDLASLDGIFIDRDICAPAADPLEKLATRLFDPKRVRAAQAGVAILPVKLESASGPQPVGGK